ncbi:MAG: hypothetical protein ACREAY_02110 [Nitrososphaera sp.]
MPDTCCRASRNELEVKALCCCGGALVHGCKECGTLADSARVECRIS